jgi:hypothetical protein
MACRSHGIIPPVVDILTIHKEAAAARAACKEQGQEVKRRTCYPTEGGWFSRTFRTM